MSSFIARCVAFLVIPLCCLVAMDCAVAQDRVRLPDIGSSANTIINPAEEEKLARSLVRELRRLNVLENDPLINSYISDLGYELVSHSDEPTRDYTFLVIRDQRINAFATLGGYIVVHTGLVETAESESELAAVLSHEIVHVTQDHLVRRFESMSKVSLPILLGMLGAIAAGGGDVAGPALVTGQALMAQQSINYTRGNELEADRLGMIILDHAGYNPESMATFFLKVERATRSYGEDIPEFLRTHPVTVTRVSEARARAAQMGAGKSRDDRRFHLMRARMSVLAEKDPAKAVIAHRDRLDADDVQDPVAAQYALALAYLRDDKPDRAEPIYRRLLEEDEDRLVYQLDMADLERRQGKTEQAAQRFEHLRDLYPASEAVMIDYAELLLEAGSSAQAKQAEKILREPVRNSPGNYVLQSLYARAADRAGRPVAARIALAESHFLSGDLIEAARQYRVLLNMGGRLSYYERSQVEARLAEIDQQIVEDERRR